MPRGLRIGYVAPTAHTITAAQGSYALGGQANAFLRARRLVAAQGAYALSGQVATLRPGVINFLWDANDAGDNVTSYKLYHGTSSGTYTTSISIGNVTSYSLTPPGGTRYYAITATNASGESAFSNELVR